MSPSPERRPPSRRSPWIALGEALRKGPLLLAAFAGAAGLRLADQARFDLLLGGVAFWLVSALACRRRSPGLARVLLLAGFAMGGLAWRQHQVLLHIRAFPLAEMLSRGQRLFLSGEGWIADRVERGSHGLRSFVEIETLRFGDHEIRWSHRVPCWIQPATRDLAYGTRIRFTGRLLPLEGPSGPGGFDARRFYFRQSGSLARLEIHAGDRLEILPGRAGFPLVGQAQALRTRLEGALLHGVPDELEPYAQLVTAMVLGARENAPEALEDAFRRSGTLHLFAVSGLHVAIVTALLVQLGAALGLSRATIAPLAIPLVLFYALLTGLSPSAVRAALMATVFLAGYLCRERPRLLNSLGFAALFLLALQPQQLFQAGFQLSFAVLLSIALLARPLSAALARPFLADPFLPASCLRPLRRLADRCAGQIAALAAVSIASWLGSLGLLAWHFHSVAPVGLLANLVLVPTATVLMALAALSLLAYALGLSGLLGLCNGANATLSLALASLAQFFASWPQASLHTGSAAPPPPSGILRLELVGHRGESAALLEVPAGAHRPPLHWMIDSGGPRTYQHQVLPLLRQRGINRLDALVLSHGDQGHIGAAPVLLQHFRPPLLLEAAVENRSPVYKEIRRRHERLGGRRLELDRGQRLRVGEGLELFVLHPDSAAPGRLADDRALVLRLDYAGHRLLLSSDSGFDTEQSLLESGADLRATVWIRGQHQSAPSGLPAFVDAVGPQVVISAHADFPESERLSDSLRQHLEQRGIRLYELARTGHLRLELGPDRLRLEPFNDPEGPIELPLGEP